MGFRKVLVGTGLVLGDVTALVGLRPDLRTLVAGLAAPRSWVAATGADGAAVLLAAAGLWCVAVWLGVGLLGAAASQLPGTFGHLARAVARAVLPAALCRLLAGAAGLGVLLAPVAAHAAATSGGGRVGTATSAPSVPAPTWPADPSPAAPTLPSPAWPTAAPPPLPAPGRPPATPLPRPAPSTPHPTPQVAGTVVVAPGDSLWRIAAAHLGRGVTCAQVAAGWPRWYAANRAVIGPDPNLIRPGQRLRAPAANRSAP